MPAAIPHISVGSKFGRLTVIKNAGTMSDGPRRRTKASECSCECGAVKIIREKDIRSGKTTSCGCVHSENVSLMMTKNRIEIGSVYGRLTVVSHGDPVIQRLGYMSQTSVCRCECGNTTTLPETILRQRRTLSCGCLQKDVARRRLTTHGMRMTPEYQIWFSMKSRCLNKNNPEYHNYGGRGISVCQRWRSFVKFLEDMNGRSSNDLSIDRIDVNGNYEPGNCRWATAEEQANNKRNNVKLTFYGKTMTLVQWSRISLVRQGTILYRIRSGWSEKRAVWTPARKMARKTEAA